MEHDERMALAVRMVDRFFEEQGPNALLGGVYGSTARRTDTAFSDLETYFIVADGKEEERHSLHGDIAVSMKIIPGLALEETVCKPTIRWPFHMGVLDSLRVLAGEARMVENLLQYGTSVEQERFDAALKEALPQLVFESWGRIRSCEVRGNRMDLPASCLEVVLEMVTALCLLNRSWVTHDYFEGVREALRFELLPKDFGRLAESLWTAKEPSDARRTADELVANFLELLRERPAFQNM
ncbi:MAG: hypothetical protein ACYTGV_17435 [Planctomycetota bacterium]|jgi:kanamycin nucleotidyltransferase